MSELIEQERKLVLQRLGRQDLTREVLSMLVFRLVELSNPDKAVDMVSESEIRVSEIDGGSSTMHLHNLLIECEKFPEERAEIVERYVRVISPGEGELDSDEEVESNIVALVRDSVYREYVKESDKELITSHLLGDLWIIYAFDRRDSTTIVLSEKAMKLGLNADRLYELGVSNVQRILGDMSFTPYGECFTLECEMICYASSVLLLDFLWEQAAQHVDGDVIVAVPARDTVIFTGSANAQGLKELREEARHITLNGHHVVTDTLLRRVDGRWKLFA